jgi:hypothetical protein
MVQSSFFSKSSYHKTARTLYLRATMSYLVQVYIRESMMYTDGESMMHADGKQTRRRAVV